jgi:iron complex outermembrane recepter protein
MSSSARPVASGVQFESIDHYMVGTDSDGSGQTSYAQSLPVLALMYALSEKVHLYTRAGRGYETSWPIVRTA